MRCMYSVYITYINTLVDKDRSSFFWSSFKIKWDGIRYKFPDILLNVKKYFTTRLDDIDTTYAIKILYCM